MVAVAAVYCWWAAGLSAFSWSATLAWALPGVIVAVAVARRRRPDAVAAPVSRTGATAWAVTIAGVVVWELVQYRSSPRSAHPTLSAMTDALLESRPARAVAFACWLVCGWVLSR